jgi:hypothetical protein
MTTTVGASVSAPAPPASPKPKRRRWSLEALGAVVVAAGLIVGIALSAGGGGAKPTPQIVGSLELTGSTYKNLADGAACAGSGYLANVKGQAKVVLYGTDSKVLSTATLPPGIVAAKMCVFLYSFDEVADSSEYTVGIDRVPQVYKTKAELKADKYRFKLTTKNIAPKTTSKPAAKATAAAKVTKK